MDSLYSWFGSDVFWYGFVAGMTAWGFAITRIESYFEKRKRNRDKRHNDKLPLTYAEFRDDTRYTCGPVPFIVTARDDD